MRLLKHPNPPQHWRYNPPISNGPYRKAPDEFGGEWWLVSPFSDPHPWLGERPKQGPQPTPEFIKIFGERPKFRDFIKLKKSALMAFQVAVVTWEQDLAQFVGSADRPPNYDDELFVASMEVLAAWGLGRPAFYEGKFGWMGRFIESDIRDYDSSAWQIINYPHHVVSQFQIANYRQNGVIPEKWHPFVPPVILGQVISDQEE